MHEISEKPGVSSNSNIRKIINQDNKFLLDLTSHVVRYVQYIVRTVYTKQPKSDIFFQLPANREECSEKNNLLINQSERRLQFSPNQKRIFINLCLYLVGIWAYHAHDKLYFRKVVPTGNFDN